MQRVAALYLPMWAVERLRRAERTAAPPEPAARGAAPHAGAGGAGPAPRNTGWRPGARWAREERAQAIAAPGGAPSEARAPRAPAKRTATVAPAFRGKAPPPPAAGPDTAGSAPLVTCARAGSRVLIAAACPEARALGIRPGMALTAARAQLPGLDVRPADPEGDRAALHRLAALAARRWSPVVMRDGDDGLLIDLSGVAHLFGGEAALARGMLRMLVRAGFSGRIAIADTAGAAHALARFGGAGDATGNGGVRLCPPGRQGEALAPLPTEALRIEAGAAELLRRLGVERIGTLAAMPRAPLVRRFGAALALRLDQALGHAPEPLDPIVPVQPIAIVRRFAEPIATAEAIAHWLGRLVPELARALEAAGLGARQVELIAERVDGVPQRIRIGLARASRDAAHLARLLARRIEDIEPGYGIDALTLHLRRAEPLGPMPVGERIDAETVPDLAPLIDTLATRIGMARLWRARAVESDVPERSVASAPALDPPAASAPILKRDDVRQLGRADPLVPWHARWPRPARLLRRPEPVDDVIALLPDQPPRRFTWRGRTHRVVRADGPERIQGEWWRQVAEAHSTRDYFQVEDEEGRRYWLFRRGDGERAVTGDLSWYLHGVFG